MLVEVVKARLKLLSKVLEIEGVPQCDAVKLCMPEEDSRPVAVVLRA